MDMAEYDLEDAELDLQHGRFPSAVYHAQQASEKACKALLALFGVEAGKTHFPSELLREIVSEEKAPPSISGKLEEVLLYARTLEDQRTAPRYGWETPRRIIKPSEIYDERRARDLVEAGRRVVELAREVMDAVTGGGNGGS